MLTTSDERDFECLCKLLKTVGKLLDQPKSVKRMDAYFVRIQELTQDESLSSRIRFMLQVSKKKNFFFLFFFSSSFLILTIIKQDILEQRENKWIPRREETKAKKIDEIHEEVFNNIIASKKKNFF